MFCQTISDNGCFNLYSTDCVWRRYMSEILPIRRKTPSIQSINWLCLKRFCGPGEVGVRKPCKKVFIQKFQEAKELQLLYKSSRSCGFWEVLEFSCLFPRLIFSNFLVNPNFILRSNFDSGQLHVFVIILFVRSFHSSREYFPHMHGDVDIEEAVKSWDHERQNWPRQFV